MGHERRSKWDTLVLCFMLVDALLRASGRLAKSGVAVSRRACPGASWLSVAGLAAEIGMK